tara:strand:+ start:2918 stop:3289 length:372 start_codon:yes stop_codon:yes gene_type:complete
MAHFAKVNSENVVEEVLVVPDEQEDRGQEFLANDLGLGGTWIQTSYNTYENVHNDGGTPLRGNYATIGGTYDADNDIFLPPKLYDSWTLNVSDARYDPPTPHPGDDLYEWNEETLSWDLVTYD